MRNHVAMEQFLEWSGFLISSLFIVGVALSSLR
jgi:hypothetical protein